ncbi:leukocyte elastase inhibitor-like isoform X2 [Hypanus sabinus]|uniref:leukocyte elastase inhibitor-like isoform X2 n=1 Tax=Hypanus sabinus TaxID=79690 RepID=UPI0028C480AB|nr:leukocyte elastase inhibitor-like isoform X2 [Hypanus sabinus]
MLCTHRTAMGSLTDVSTKFALDLLRQLSEGNRTENIFFSPLSISTALLMVHLGARGSTLIQLAKVLHLGGEEQPHHGFQQLQCEVNKPSPSHLLKTANGLFGERSFSFHPGYIESISRFHKAELTAVDFAEGAEEARIQINSWVEEQTEGKIQNLLVQGAVDSQSKLVLVNAVYFKGVWEKKFNEEDTKYRPFRFSEVTASVRKIFCQSFNIVIGNLLTNIFGQTESKSVKMMYQKGTFKTSFIEELAADILELPYVQNELSMLILLPEEIGGLEELEKKLTSDKLLEWTSPENLEPSKMSIYLPKFKLEAKYDLEPTLKRLGISAAFDSESADFSGMTAAGGLSLSKIVHNCFVEVNEAGTEGAASSQVTMMFRSLHFEDEFIADHPFLFFIRHNKTRSILFFGRFSSP